MQIEYILGKQIERNKIEYIGNKQIEYIREEELTSDDVDHGAGEVGVWRSTRVLPTIRVPHLQVVSFGQLGNYVCIAEGASKICWTIAVLIIEKSILK